MGVLNMLIIKGLLYCIQLQISMVLDLVTFLIFMVNVHKSAVRKFRDRNIHDSMYNLEHS